MVPQGPHHYVTVLSWLNPEILRSSFHLNPSHLMVHMVHRKKMSRPVKKTSMCLILVVLALRQSCLSSPQRRQREVSSLNNCYVWLRDVIQYSLQGKGEKGITSHQPVIEPETYTLSWSSVAETHPDSDHPDSCRVCRYKLATNAFESKYLVNVVNFMVTDVECVSRLVP